MSNLTSDNHPRVIYSDSDFLAIRDMVSADTNNCLAEMHGIIIETAESYVGAPDIDRTFIGKRLLSVSRKSLRQMIFCAYAYKTTGERRFLEQVRRDMRAVCDFEDWNALRHFLDAGEMAAGVGLAYDWLYNDLDEETKEMARKALDDFAFEPALNGNPRFYSLRNNWNSVCNGGLVCAALAVYEDNRSVAQAIIEKAVESNVLAMNSCYSPDGNYPEGYSYWNYGTVYEALMLTALGTATGSDNGLSDIPGFSKTGRYMIYMEGPSGMCHNYSDCMSNTDGCPAQWYFAWKFGDRSVLYLEKDKISSYKFCSTFRLLPLIAWYASKVDISDIPAPADNVFYGEGSTPVVLVHDTWTMDENDKFLGIKGGKGTTPHSHLDGGSFVYDADGVRWAADYNREEYSAVEAHLSDFWRMTDGSGRWTVFRYNNFNHNTLTVNGEYHKVDGEAKFLEIIDTDGRRGAVVDMTAPLGEEVSSAVRTIYLKGDDLVVEDKITALKEKPANVRWTMVTQAQPTVGDNAITLSREDKSRLLTCSSPTGHNVELTTWSTQSTNSWDSSNAGFYECGYTVTVNPGDTAVIVTRLTREH